MIIEYIERVEFVVFVVKDKIVEFVVILKFELDRI